MLLQPTSNVGRRRDWSRLEFRGLPDDSYAVAAVLKGANSEPLTHRQQEVKVVKNLLAR
jgi:hypothetical protein